MGTLEGQTLGQYRLLRLIGRGGMGTVYLAEDIRRPLEDARHQVAIKVVPVSETTLSSDADALRLFHEGRFLTELRHPHILPIYHDGIRDDLLFLVMPYMPDGSLADAMHGRSGLQLELPLHLEQVADYIGQVAEALQYTHDRHIIHRDVKPGNVLVEVQPHGYWHLFLSDFGVARRLDTTTQKGHWTGTLVYMAPEQFRGELSRAVDQYALAVMAVQLLTGQVPWGMAPPAVRTLNPAVSEAVEVVLLRALAARPAERFASVTAFAVALRDACATSDSARMTMTEPSSIYTQAAPLAAARIPADAAIKTETGIHRVRTARRRNGERASNWPDSRTLAGAVMILALVVAIVATLAYFGPLHLGAGPARPMPTHPPHASLYLSAIGSVSNLDGSVTLMDL